MGKGSATKDISVLLYTEAQMRTQIKNTPNVKDPEKNWLNMLPISGQDESPLHETEESIEGMMVDINTGKPFLKRYVWEYSAPTTGLRGLYLVICDKDKAIIPQVQRDLDALVSKLCAEFGFTIVSNEKNITGYYQKFSIRKK